MAAWEAVAPFTEKSLGLFLGGQLRRPVLVQHYTLQLRASPDTTPYIPFETRFLDNLHSCACLADRKPSRLTQEHNEIHRGISIAYALYKYCNFILPVRHILLSSLDLLTASPFALHSHFHTLYTPHQLCKLMLAFDWQNRGVTRTTQK